MQRKSKRNRKPEKQQAPKRPRGRPRVELDEAKLDRLFYLVADGFSLREACREVGFVRANIRRRIVDDPVFAARFARARMEQLATHADDLIAIADDLHTDPQDKKLMLDTRKWLLSKLRPEEFGDRVAVGGDPKAPPVRVEMSDEDLARQIEEMLERAERRRRRQLTHDHERRVHGSCHPEEPWKVHARGGPQGRAVASRRG